MDTSTSRRKLFDDEAEAREFVRDCGLGWIGSDVRYFDETDSTNTQARKLADIGRSNGALVVAEYQTHGRGRHGRRWTCPARAGLLLSVLVDRSRFTEQGGLALPWLTAAGALAMARAAGDACGGDILIEWPNDLVAVSKESGDKQSGGNDCGGEGATRKLGGVLVEGQQDAPLLVLGVGLNVDVRPDEFSPEITGATASLLTAFGTAPERRAVLRGFLRGIEERLANVKGLPAELRERSATLGREVTVQLDGRAVRGRATAFDGRMRLVVELPGGRVEAVASAGML